MSKEIKPVDTVTITFDDGNYKIVTTIKDDGEKTILSFVADMEMPMDYESVMINIHRIFLEALSKL